MQHTIGYIILLNGTSSSGKSTILKEFHKLQPTYKIFKVDDWFPEQLNAKAKEWGWTKESGRDPWLFLHEYVTVKTNKYYFDTELRAALFKEIPEFYKEAKKALLQGNNTIIDTVFEYDPEYEKFVQFFNDFNVIKVLVYCPLDTLLQRVEERNKTGNSAEIRSVFQSFEQFPAIYKMMENSNEQIVDKVKSSVIKQALQDSIQNLIDNSIPESYLPKLEHFKKDFTEQFKLNEQEEIVLVPRHNYNLILNSGINKPQELAKKLFDFIHE